MKINLDLSTIDKNDIVFENDYLLILSGDTKEKCIKYGFGNLKHKNNLNMWNVYRYRYSENNIYIIYDKTTNYNKVMMLFTAEDDFGNKYFINHTNKYNLATTSAYCVKYLKFQPLLEFINFNFVNLPLTQNEINIISIIANNVKDDDLSTYFNSYDVVEAYIAKHVITDNQYKNLTYDLKFKYINLKRILSDNMLLHTSKKLISIYNKIHSLQYRLDSYFTKEQIYNLTSLELMKSNITNLKGIENLKKLEYLSIYKNKIKSLEGIEKCKNLNELWLDNNQISDLTPLNNLNLLKKLDISNNKVKTLKPLEKLSNLVYLVAHNNNLKNLKGLENKFLLESTYLSDNKIKNLDALKASEKLESLYLFGNNIDNIDGIIDFKNLKYLDIESDKPLNIDNLFKDTFALQKIRILGNGVLKIYDKDTYFKEIIIKQ